MASREVGEELAYPALPAALLTALFVVLLSSTLGRFLIERSAVEKFIRDWLWMFQPFVDVLPLWAREAPVIFGAIAIAAIISVRLLAGGLPSIALYLMVLGVACAMMLIAPPTHLPSGPEDWIFVSYVTLSAFIGGAPRPYENRI
jgi:hypothetical protein